ncbi:MAG: hypothetical protein WBD07_13660 [Vicinamibacterales bacterium]
MSSMKRISVFVVTLAALLATRPLVLAQGDVDRVTVAFSDPSRPGTIRVNLMQGRITVKGTNRRDVAVVYPAASEATRRRADQPPETSGLRRLTQPTGLTIDEENNVMSIGNGRFGGKGGELTIEVPLKTNLRLTMLNGGPLVVEGVEGEIEVNNMNGPITLTDVAGSVVAHSMNGKVVATLRQVTAQKPMAFTSMNGAVDVTLPGAVKANLKLRSDNGDIYTDFDVQLRAQAAKTPTVQDSRSRGGRFRLEVDSSVNGSINGGGPEFEIRTFNGAIYLRKGK